MIIFLKKLFLKKQGHMWIRESKHSQTYVEDQGWRRKGQSSNWPNSFTPKNTAKNHLQHDISDRHCIWRRNYRQRCREVTGEVIERCPLGGADRRGPALAPFSRSWFSLEPGRTERNHAVATSVSWGGRSREKQIQSNCGNLVHRRPPAKFPLLGANPWVRRSQAHNWLLLRPEMQQEEEKQPGDSRRKLNRGHAVPCVLAKL